MDAQQNSPAFISQVFSFSLHQPPESLPDPSHLPLADPRNHTSSKPGLQHLQVQDAKLDPCVWYTLLCPFCCALAHYQPTSVIRLQCCVHIWVDFAVTGEHSNSQGFCCSPWTWIKPYLLSMFCSTALTCSYPVQLCTCMPAARSLSLHSTYHATVARPRSYSNAHQQPETPQMALNPQLALPVASYPGLQYDV